MRRIPWVLVLAVVAGCKPPTRMPSVLSQTEFKNRVLVRTAGRLDPESILLTLHKKGLIRCEGEDQSRADIARRVGSGAGTPNRTPILFEIEPDTEFGAVRDALAILIRHGCVNYAFLVEGKYGPGTVPLPMLGFNGPGYHVYEGREKEMHVGKFAGDRQLEVVVSPGKGGEITVMEINYCVPDEFMFERRDDVGNPPSYAWEGEHLPCGMWTKEMLRTFLSRADVVERLPYVLFKVTTQEPASDVIRCLSVLKTLRNVVIVPSIPTR